MVGGGFGRKDNNQEGITKTLQRCRVFNAGTWDISESFLDVSYKQKMLYGINCI